MHQIHVVCIVSVIVIRLLLNWCRCIFLVESHAWKSTTHHALKCEFLLLCITPGTCSAWVDSRGSTSKTLTSGLNGWSSSSLTCLLLLAAADLKAAINDDEECDDPRDYNYDDQHNVLRMYLIVDHALVFYASKSLVALSIEVTIVVLQFQTRVAHWVSRAIALAAASASISAVSVSLTWIVTMLKVWTFVLVATRGHALEVLHAYVVEELLAVDANVRMDAFAVTAAEWPFPAVCIRLAVDVCSLPLILIYSACLDAW